ncbi:hypothetical protein FHL15_000321 [Xylaria flabelliformis]|uniref:Uncharacterized protein n=1 Tax=Xylaria flabelliformis TaxID=2512241 RepID=A0A553IFK1_9PEZI|nr:hypothetical protein FHL15_000321 [Xylaria flabelliformis]
MKFTAAISVGLGLAGITNAAPLTTRTTKSAAEIILAIAPDSGTCSSAKTECRTNMQVGPLMAKAAAQYGLDHAAPIAAVLALTAFESVEYQFNTNQGRNAGQGTSNMQMYSYNLLYAQSIPALADPLGKLGTPAELGGTKDPDLMNKVRALVITDQYNFGSGFWFLTKQCKPEVIQQLKDNADAGFAAYMQCVGVTPTPDRQAYWTKAKNAFGL